MIIIHSAQIMQLYIIMSCCCQGNKGNHCCCHIGYEYVAELNTFPERFNRLLVGKYDDDAPSTFDSGFGSTASSSVYSTDSRLSEVSQREVHMHVHCHLVASSPGHTHLNVTRRKREGLVRDAT